MGCLVRETASPAEPGAVERLARTCSPRVLACGDRAAIFDASGLTRVIGPPAEITAQLMRLAAGEGLTLRMALASTRTSAWLLAHARAGVTIVPAGEDAAALASLPLTALAHLPDQPEPGTAPRGRTATRHRRSPARHYRIAPGPPSSAVSTAPPALPKSMAELLDILHRWGLQTLGDLARLPRADVHARLGTFGVHLHQAACGEDASPFQPADERRPMLERVELEWPVDGLEPLSFVLARLCDALETRLERADRGAVVVTTRLILVTRETHARVLHLPAAMRDARMLRTLILLDLESHPPAAGIDAIEIEVEVAPGRVVQTTLLSRPLPSAEQITTLLARLRALMGESRVGAPAIVDSHDEREVAMAEFQVNVGRVFRPGILVFKPGIREIVAKTALRRCRLPIAARVVSDRQVPTEVWPAARRLPGGRIVARAGPWRSSGRWWSLDGTAWDRDVWDIETAAGHVYRLSRDRRTLHWAIEGIVD
jgi:protein ImuB